MPEPIDVFPVEHLPEYIIGLPVHVAVTVRAPASVSFNGVRFADIGRLNECIGLEMPSGGYMPKPMFDPHERHTGARLEPGEIRRMLTDVSPLIGTAITEGTHTLQFYYVTPFARYAAPPVTIRFRRATPEEMAVVRTLAADRPGLPNWALWTTTCPKDPIVPEQYKIQPPLEFNLTLRQLFCSPTKLETVDPLSLNDLTGLFQPERRALQAELLKIRKDENNYQQLRTQILRETPGLAWWINRIDTGGGAFLKTYRLPPYER